MHPETPATDNLLTTRQAAAVCGLSYKAFLAARLCGLTPVPEYTGPGGVALYDASELAAWNDARLAVLAAMRDAMDRGRVRHAA